MINLSSADEVFRILTAGLELGDLENLYGAMSHWLGGPDANGSQIPWVSGERLLKILRALIALQDLTPDLPPPSLADRAWRAFEKSVTQILDQAEQLADDPARGQMSPRDFEILAQYAAIARAPTPVRVIDLTIDLTMDQPDGSNAYVVPFEKPKRPRPARKTTKKSSTGKRRR